MTEEGGRVTHSEHRTFLSHAHCETGIYLVVGFTEVATNFELYTRVYSLGYVGIAHIVILSYTTTTAFIIMKYTWV